ncbi:hypothetical protein GCM10010191_56450 [Actinomadura vinacea]|uniref:Asp23/Gls24 family envelope stress response protein n=1 Tax=Actinomadura vinacea TaxID=115336 RepID=A0ABN3JQL0_9ACTN
MSEKDVRTAKDRPDTGTLPSQAPRPGAEPKAEREGARLEKPAGRTASELTSEYGRTKIADTVVAKIAGMAAREVGGVYDMGAGMMRTFGSVKERLPGGMGRQSMTQGVSVQVGERQAAVDLSLIVDYGVSIPDLSAAVRENVINGIEHMCGLDVVEVNIDVADIHVPGEEEEAPPSEPRVR